jgi:hypothetical protein
MFVQSLRCRWRSSERRKQTSSAGPGWRLGGLRQASLVAGAGEAEARGAVAEVCPRTAEAPLLARHAGRQLCVIAAHPQVAWPSVGSTSVLLAACCRSGTGFWQGSCHGWLRICEWRPRSRRVSLLLLAALLTHA